MTPTLLSNEELERLTRYGVHQFTTRDVVTYDEITRRLLATIQHYRTEAETAKAERQRLVNLLVHVHNEVAVLEDFDADSLMKEIGQAISGEKAFEDNVALESALSAAREALKPFAKHADTFGKGWERNGKTLFSCGPFDDARSILATSDAGAG